MLAFQRIAPYGQDSPNVSSARGERMIYHTDEWLRFVAASQDATPVRAVLEENGRVLGETCGLVVSKLGMKILGSPLPGWTTMYMGFVLEPGVPRWEALEALRTFAFGVLGCVHLEVVDRHLSPGSTAPAHDPEYVESWETDLTRSEDELFGAMDGACRRCIRKAEKSGVTIEEAEDDAFADDYYAQLIEVFRKQGLVPTYGVDRVPRAPSEPEAERAGAPPAGAGSRGEVHRHRNLSRDEPGRAVLGERELPRVPEPEAQRGAQLVRAAHLEEPRRRGVRLGRGRHLQGEVRVHAPAASRVFRDSKYPLLAHLRSAAQLAFQGRQRLLGALHVPRGSA
jgi:hypothetical protein